MTEFLLPIGKFFVSKMDDITLVCCILGAIGHFFINELPFKSSEFFKNLVFRIFAAANVPMVPALISCAAYPSLFSEFNGTTVNLVVAAAASAYATYYAFVD